MKIRLAHTLPHDPTKNRKSSHALAGALFAACCALSAVAVAQPAADSPQSMHGMSMNGTAQGANAPSSQAFRRADANMMQAMSAPYTGDADQDFVSHMIPHHAGAVEMARIELKYGKDPVLRKLAKNIIRDQQKEIALMRRWQAAHPASK